MKEFTIGSKVYLMHHKYVNANIIGARIILAKVKTFRRATAGIQPIFYGGGQ